MSLQQQFVDDDEITRLLAAAREDQAEHGKKDKVAAARRLLAAQRFADALALLDAVLATDPKDSAVLKLRTGGVAQSPLALPVLGPGEGRNAESEIGATPSRSVEPS